MYVSWVHPRPHALSAKSDDNDVVDKNTKCQRTTNKVHAILY